MDPGILCFQHCKNKIFCSTIPDNCPVCGSKLDYKILPFRIPYPFVKASQFPRAIVMKPTNGDFLSDYYNSKDLHIGITTSQGNVVEFSEHGVRGVETLGSSVRIRKTSHIGWEQSLLVEQFSELWSSYWDNTLLEVSEKSQWLPSNYDEEKNNCLSFVLYFLKSLNCGDLSRKASDPKLFCENFIVGRTSTAGKYISLYRQLKQNKYLIKKCDS